MDKSKIRETVRERYGKIAENRSSCCGPSTSNDPRKETMSGKIGYGKDELNTIPDLADMGLGCGNPTAMDSINEGEVVIDLGSGGGIDCFLAANKVGKTGHVVGVDMTATMIDRARENAKEGGYENVEFRLGEIEHLPVADNFADLIISNCVINLSPDKDQVFKEAYRALKPGGRMMISDIVLLEELPEFVQNSMDAYVGCVAGANLKEEYLKKMEEAGFEEIEVVSETSFGIIAGENELSEEMIKEAEDCGATVIKATMDEMSEEEIERVKNSIVSINVKAVKPE
ncbi:MAG: arsenite methyltransferase [Candidatus Heimdallarchaeota archaeon]|nr:arsenite methyltransferase [Candidatus Heimdallarchaeota archaeon]MCK5048176.1 arsenite methyltransferase [Candidatus Heimdallarchaeota archaeon]